MGFWKDFCKDMDKPAFKVSWSEVKQRNDLYVCNNSACNHIWRTKNSYVGSHKCPSCNSKNISITINKNKIIKCFKCDDTLTEDIYGGKCGGILCQQEFCTIHIHDCESCGRSLCENCMPKHWCIGGKR